MIRVQIADGHPLILAGLRVLLEGANLSVVAATCNGDEALVQIREQNPTVLVLGLDLPGKDGIEILQSIRECGDWRPVILLPGPLSNETLWSALNWGINGILSKEYCAETLVPAVRIVSQGGTFFPPELMTAVQPDPAHRTRLRMWAKLSNYDRALAKAVGAGHRNRDIATQLGKSEAAIRVALHRLFKKMGVASRTELALLLRETAG